VEVNENSELSCLNQTISVIALPKKEEPVVEDPDKGKKKKKKASLLD
jgi:hypothetical protein